MGEILWKAHSESLLLLLKEKKKENLKIKGKNIRIIYRSLFADICQTFLFRNYEQGGRQNRK